jgi:hypothetical protein
MALRFKRTIGGVGRKLEKVLLANTQTVEVGDVIETYTTGLGVLGLTRLPILGVIDSICDKDGLPFKSSNPVAGTASGTDTLSKATGSGGDVYAMVDVSKDSIFSGSVNGTINNTGTSGKRGCWINIDSAGGDYGRILESTATREHSSNTATSSNFYSHGVDPSDSTRLLVSIANQEFGVQYDLDAT